MCKHALARRDMEHITTDIYSSWQLSTLSASAAAHITASSFTPVVAAFSLMTDRLVYNGCRELTVYRFNF